MSGAACELVARCFAVRTSAHLAHLCTTSYAQHMALGDFYDAIAASADEFFECWMGIFGKVEISAFPAQRLPASDPVTQLSDLRKWLVENREECCEAYTDKDVSNEPAEDADQVGNTELANLIDNILAVVDRTTYKLKFLG